MMNTRLKLFLIIIITSVSFSCKKNFDTPSWDIDALAPLVNTTLSLNDLLTDSVLETNPDGSLYMTYQSDLLDIDVDSIFKIPDTTIVEEYVVPLTTVAYPNSTFYSNDEEKKLNINNGIELTYGLVESGFINLEVYSEVMERVVVTLKILSATQNGDTLLVTDTLDAATVATPGYLSVQFDLSGYELDLTGINNNTTNMLVTKANATIHPDGVPWGVVVSSGTKLTYHYNFVDVVPYYVKGYFGNQNYHFGPDTTEFEVFNSLLDGTIDLNEVDVTLDFENGIGADAQLSTTQFTSVNTGAGTYSSLTGGIITSPININRAQETNSVPEVIYSIDQKVLNTTNSNIDELIEVLPDKLVYEGDLIINPLANISGSNDFFYKAFPLKANLNIEMPLSLVANNLTLADTVDFNLDPENIEDIIEGSLLINADNGYPFDAVFKLELLDQNNQISKELTLVNNTIAAAPVNSQLKVETPRFSILALPLSPEDITTLTLAKKMKITVAFTTTEQPQHLKIYSDYKIDITIVGDFSYKVNAD